MIRSLEIPKLNSSALSVSVGDGIWDYLAFKAFKKKLSITATDIVKCPVSIDDIIKLRSKGNWIFKKKEEYRVLKPGGYLLFGTPNLFRPMNILKIIFGRLEFPINIGGNKEIGDYIHIQEFNEWQLTVMLQEVGFKIKKTDHCFFGINPLNIQFSKFPKKHFTKVLCHYLHFLAYKN